MDKTLLTNKERMKLADKFLSSIINPAEYAGMSHRRYMGTRRWKAIRHLIITRDAGKCLLCDSDGTHVHHKTYKNFGNEYLHEDDLVLLCGDCHSKIHDNNAHCENSVTIIFDSNKHKELLKGNPNSVIFNIETLWDEETLLKQVAEIINKRLSNISRENNTPNVF